MSTIEPERPGVTPGADPGSGAPDGTNDGALVDRRAVLSGALVGLAVLVVASVVGALLDRNLSNYDDSAWRPLLFVVVLVGYVSAGFLAGRKAPDGALTNGALAATSTFVLWIPLRILIWVVRDENKALFTGVRPVFTIPQIFGNLVIASALGMLGGAFGARLVVKRVR